MNEVDDFELPERRRRDYPELPGDKADCCKDAARVIAEIPRTRNKGNDVNAIPPARMRLCWHHSKILLSSDPKARCYPITRSAPQDAEDMQG